MSTEEAHTTQPPADVLIAVGSNHDAAHTLCAALSLVPALLEDPVCTRVAETQAIGIDAPDFHNLLITGKVRCDAPTLTSRLKAIEQACGDTRALRARHLIRLDLDLLALGDARYHAPDWTRYYIRTLLEELHTLCADRPQVGEWLQWTQPQPPMQ